MRNIIISTVALLAILPAAGASGPKINAATNIDWTKVQGSTAPSATCNSSIYGMPYTNTATGDFYVCAVSGWVLVTSGGGGGISGSATSGFLAIGTGAASIGPSLADYGVSTANTFTFPKAVAVSVSGGGGGAVDMLEGTAPSAAASHDILYADSTAHCIKQSLNNGAFACLGASAGTVTSVAQTVPSWLTVSGSPVTTMGTLAITATTAQTSHQVIGTCNAGTTFAPCSLVIGDLPTITAAKGGTGIDTSASTGVAQVSSGTWSVSTALASGTTATTQSANDNSTKVATTAYADGVLGAQYKKWSCQPGIGDGVNAIVAATYLQYTCLNTSGVTWTITNVKCLTDNNGTSTLNVTNGAGTALLTGAITCTNSFAAGTQSGTTTIASGDYLKWTFVSDGTSKQSTFVINGTY